MVGGKKQRWAEVEQETGRKDTDSGVCLGSNAKKGWGGGRVQPLKQSPPPF